MEADDTQSTAELVTAFNVSIKAILVHLPQIRKVKMPHGLYACQFDKRIKVFLALLNPHGNEKTKHNHRIELFRSANASR